MKPFLHACTLSLLLGMSTVPALASSFFDVPPSHTAYESIEFLHTLEVITGRPDGSFTPELSINRAEFAKLIIAASSEEIPSTPSTTCFQDVALSTWYAPYVCEAKALGYMTGQGDGSIFAPEQPLNGAEILVIMQRVFQWEQDHTNTTTWYADALSNAQEKGLLPSSFAIDSSISRGVMAEIVARSITIAYLDIPVFTDTNLFDSIVCSSCNGPDSTDTSPEIQASYTIRQNTLTPIFEAPTISTEHVQKVWDVFTSLIPLYARRDVATFSLFSDGADGLLAQVAGSTEDPLLWTMEVDIKDGLLPDGSINPELPATMIHEFAHIFSLRNTQMRADQTSETCTTYFLEEGCTSPTSYLNVFYTTFWKNTIQDHPIASTPSPRDEDIDAYYYAHEDSFITPYAATHPVEDFAESFTYFVLENKPTNTTLIRNQKLLFFYSYPYLVELRKSIRNSTYLKE